MVGVEWYSQLAAETTEREKKLGTRRMTTGKGHYLAYSHPAQQPMIPGTLMVGNMDDPVLHSKTCRGMQAQSSYLLTLASFVGTLQSWKRHLLVAKSLEKSPSVSLEFNA